MESATAIPLRVPLRREDVLHFLGYRGRGVPGGGIRRTLDETLEEARALVAPWGVYRALDAAGAGALGLETRPGAGLALGLVTIGAALEREVSRLLSEGETTHALLLDAAGSAATEEAADALEELIGAADSIAGTAHRRFSPGYGSWPLTAQRAVFEWLPYVDIGVMLLPSCLMSPRKSISFALWLDVGTSGHLPVPRECRDRRCADCDLTTCPYRES